MNRVSISDSAFLFIQTIKRTVVSLVLFYEVLPYLADKISQILAFGNTNTMNEPKKSSTQKRKIRIRCYCHCLNCNQQVSALLRKNLNLITENKY